MNAMPLDGSRWSRRTWAYAILGVLIAQTLLIVVLGERRIRAPATARFGLRIDMAADAQFAKAASGKSVQYTGLTPSGDPAVFALPNWNGFSRAGWLAFERPEFKPADWTEPPQWLPLNTADLGNSLHHFILSNTIAPLLIANAPVPASVRQDESVPNPPLRNESELVFEGELALWTTAAPLELPSWRHSDLLMNTVVRAVVNRSGRTMAVTLLAGSGSADADAFAMRTARDMRLQSLRGRPGRGAEVTSGTLVFRWHTLAPTNAPGVSFGSP